MSEYCTRCCRVLNEDEIVWLELDKKTGLYHHPGVIPKDRSQGEFPFGKDCATAQIQILVNKQIEARKDE